MKPWKTKETLATQVRHPPHLPFIHLLSTFILSISPASTLILLLASCQLPSLSFPLLLSTLTPICHFPSLSSASVPSSIPSHNSCHHPSLSFSLCSPAISSATFHPLIVSPVLSCIHLDFIIQHMPCSVYVYCCIC